MLLFELECTDGLLISEALIKEKNKCKYIFRNKAMTENFITA